MGIDRFSILFLGALALASGPAFAQGGGCAEAGGVIMATGECSVDLDPVPNPERPSCEDQPEPQPTESEQSPEGDTPPSVECE